MIHRHIIRTIAPEGPPPVLSSFVILDYFVKPENTVVGSTLTPFLYTSI